MNNEQNLDYSTLKSFIIESYEDSKLSLLPLLVYLRTAVIGLFKAILCKVCIYK